MSWLQLLLSAYLLVLFSSTLHSLPASRPESEYYLVISCDGFRWDFLDIAKSRGRATPSFDYLINGGVKAEYMKNAFVTMTWPNHWTMATGLHVESHGIVSNKFYDTKMDAFYDGPRTGGSRWFKGEGEPIWVTYQKASKQHRSASAVWPGGVVEVDGVTPTYSLPQDNSIPLTDRIDSVFQWFTKSKKPAHLAMLYIDEPDKTGHDFGPDSDEMMDKIEELDGLIGYILDKLQETDLLPVMNMIITSDHGMSSVNATYRLSDYIHSSQYVLSGMSPNYMFLPVKGAEQTVHDALKGIPHSTVYWKEEIPDDLYYRDNDRILPLILMMKEGFMTCCPEEADELPAAKGEHGYDNKLPSMQPFFIAHGPAFKSGYTSPALNSTDIYPLLCHMMGLEAAPNNGSLENIVHILKDGGDARVATEVEDDQDQFSQNSAKEALAQLSTAIISFIIMFCIAFVIAIVYFMLIKKPIKTKSRGKKELTVDIPNSHPDYEVSEHLGDKQWLLKSGSEGDSDSDVEEWEPLKASAKSTAPATTDTEVIDDTTPL